MDEPEQEIKAHIELAFGLSRAPWRVLHEGRVNKLFYVPARVPVVVRISSRRSVIDVQQEITLVNMLRASFPKLCRFLNTSTEGQALDLGVGRIACVYEFVEGVVQQPLSELQFNELVRTLPRFLSSLECVDIGIFSGRRFVPEADQAVSRARRLFKRLGTPHELATYLHDATWPSSYVSWCNDTAVHSDLHAGNFVWADNGELLAVLDFERFAIGSQLIEFASLVTGTCFDGYELRLDRLSLITSAVQPALLRVARTSHEIYHAILMVALYFFGRVNRFSLSAEDVIVGAVEMRDARRAICLAENKVDVLRVLDAAISFDQ